MVGTSAGFGRLHPTAQGVQLCTTGVCSLVQMSSSSKIFLFMPEDVERSCRSEGL